MARQTVADPIGARTDDGAIENTGWNRHHTDGSVSLGRRDMQR